MLFSGKWFDPVVGIDIHLIQPPGPVPPVPVPHPFIGIVYDPVGLVVGMVISNAIAGAFGGPFSGPVLINGMPAAHTGTNVKGMPVHVPIGGTFIYPPKNEGTIITGSKTVHVLGASGARLTSMVNTCNDPINLPTSVVMSIPMGAPVFTGGPTAVDWFAAVLSAIRTQWVSEQLHELFGATSGSWTSKIICFLTGHPVDVVTGQVFTDRVDFQIKGPIPFRFERTYTSASTYAGPLGYGWHHLYDQHISVRADGAYYRTDDGRDIRLDDLAVGQEIYESTERIHVSREDGGFKVGTAGRRTLYFRSLEPGDSVFHLTRVEDINGNCISLVYERGVLSRVIDSAGRVLTFLSDNAGRLVEIEAPNPAASQDTVTVARYEYDDNGDLVGYHDALGNCCRYEYRNHLLTRETDRNGFSFYFEYDEYASHGCCVRTWGDEELNGRRLTYHRAARLTVVDDSLGNKTTYFTNSLGLVDKIVDPLGGVRKFGWDPFARRVSEIDPKGAAYSWEYDGAGRCVRRTNPAGQSTEEHFDSAGRGIGYTDARGNQWLRTYDERDHVTSISDPEGNRWQLLRDVRGRISQIVNPAGSTLRYEYRRDGALTGHTDWLGNLTSYVLDGWWRPIERHDALGNVTRFVYDLVGRLKSVERADGTALRCDHDPEGNLTRLGSHDGQLNRYEYGHFNRLVQVRDVLDHVHQFDYDTEGHLIGITNPRDEKWTFERDALGKVASDRDFSGRLTVYARDAAGRIIATSNERHEVTSYERDVLGRVTRETQPDGSSRSFTYDAAGSIAEADNGDVPITYTRDYLGRVLKEIQGEAWIESTYDVLGNRIRRRTSAGDHLAFRYDANSLLSGVIFDSGHSIEIERDALGREVLRRLPGRLESERVYDNVGRLKCQATLMPAEFERGIRVERRGRRTVAVVSDREYNYSGFGLLDRVEDSRWGVMSYSHDRLNRLTERNDSPSGGSEVYSYDQSGNITCVAMSKTAGLPTIRTEFVYGPGGVLATSGRGRFEYDKNGYMVRATLDEPGEAVTYKYEWRGGRLSTVTSPDGSVYRYKYDPFGRRTRKIGPDFEERYVWDGDTLCGVGEPRRGWAHWLFDPLSFSPIAQITTDGTLRSFIVDHLDTPHEIVDQRGKITWAGRLATWGGSYETKVEEADCKLLFKGQWQDRETGLSYNRFRYYHPGAARYISPDPVRLTAGFNLYSYVPNPTGWVDPYGLASQEDMLQSALGVLKSYDKQIKEVFGDDVQYGIRGSLSTGTSYSSGQPFDPKDFDVDAFIIKSSGVPQGFSRDVMPNSMEVAELESEIENELRQLPGFEGMRELGDEDSLFAVFKRKQDGSTLACK